MAQTLDTKRGEATHQIAVMGALGDKTVTLTELTALLPISAHSIQKATGKLIQRDYLERLENGVYRLTLTGREALEHGVSLTSGPHRGQRKHMFYRDCLQQRAWSAMRLMAARFTIADIVTLAVKEDDKKPEQSLQKYFYRLTRAGYLIELPTRVKGKSLTSNGFKQWRLMRDTGDQSPRWLEKQQAFKDYNTREVFPLEEVQSCAA